jgi:guanine deaminase
MKVYDNKLGRLGNAIFRYFASTLFCIIYNAKRTYNQNEINAVVNDQIFIHWMHNVLNNIIPQIEDKNYNFYGYFQHDLIYLKFKKEILLWIENHPNDLIYTDGNDELNNNYNYNVQSYKISDLILSPQNITFYEVVIHLRLEDFINNNNVIHPNCIINILNQFDKKYNNYCFVLNEPKTLIEKEYINYLKNKINLKFNIHTKTVIEDFHIMKNAKVLICSCSTLSWCASFLSNTIEKLYFPNKKKENHETFCKPIENTIYYDIIKCSKSDLEKLFNIKDNKINYYISEACDLANYSVKKGCGPFGCVITDLDYNEIARGHNMVTENKDPTAHAEIVTIRNACNKLDNYELSNCILFSSCEPCPMCLSAIYWSRIKYIYYGNTREDAKNIGFDDSFIYDEVNKDIQNRSIKMTKVNSSNCLESFELWNKLENKKLY